MLLSYCDLYQWFCSCLHSSISYAHTSPRHTLTHTHTLTHIPHTSPTHTNTHTHSHTHPHTHTLTYPHTSPTHSHTHSLTHTYHGVFHALCPWSASPPSISHRRWPHVTLGTTQLHPWLFGLTEVATAVSTPTIALLGNVPVCVCVCVWVGRVNCAQCIHILAYSPKSLELIVESKFLASCNFSYGEETNTKPPIHRPLHT